MKSKNLLFIILIAFYFNSITATATTALEYLESFCFSHPARVAFSTEELSASHWLIHQLRDLGYEESAITIQTFPKEAARLSFFNKEINGLHLFDVKNYDIIDFSQNIIVTLKGQSDETIIFGAHYDSWPYPGASDNGASVAVLLHLAERYVNTIPAFTVKFVFFGAEESGLIGSFFYVNEMTEDERENLWLMVNADVLLDSDYCYFAATDGAKEKIGFLKGVTEKENGLYSSTDHLPFMMEKFDVLTLFSVEEISEGKWRRQVMDSENDCLDYIRHHWPQRLEHNLNIYTDVLNDILGKS